MPLTVNVKRIFDARYQDVSDNVPIDGTLDGVTGGSSWLDVTDSPFNADKTGATDSTAAFNLLVQTLAAASGRLVGFVPHGTYRAADVWMMSNVTILIEGATFKLPSVVPSTDVAVFRLLTNDRTSTSFLSNIRLIGLVRWTIDYRDTAVTYPPYIPRGIGILNCQDFEITNVDGVGIGAFAGNTIQIGNNQANTTAKHGRLVNIGSHGVLGLGSSCIQLEGGYDIEAVGLYADGGVPARIETDGNAGATADNVHMSNISLTNESGFANCAGYFESHGNTIKNSSITRFRVEGAGSGVDCSYDNGGSVSGVRIRDGLVTGGGHGVRFGATASGVTPTFPRSTVESVNVIGATGRAFDIADGVTYIDCHGDDGFLNAWLGAVNGDATPPATPAAGSRCKILGGSALRNVGAGIKAEGVELLDLVAVDAHDDATRVATGLGSELLTNTGFETNTTGWFAGNGVTSITRVTTQHNTGTASLQITPSGVGDATVRTNVGTSSIPITGGHSYQVTGFMKAGSGTARSFIANVFWYDSSGVFISTPAAINTLTNSSTWTEAPHVVAAPSNAAFAAVITVIRSPTSSDIHYFDDVSLKDATGTATQTYGVSAALNTTVNLVACDLTNNKTGRITGAGVFQEATMTTVTS